MATVFDAVALIIVRTAPLGTEIVGIGGQFERARGVVFGAGERVLRHAREPFAGGGAQAHGDAIAAHGRGGFNLIDVEERGHRAKAAKPG